MDETPYETKAVAKPAAKPKVAVVESEPTVLNDCGHSGPGYIAASGTETVVHCAACSGRSS